MLLNTHLLYKSSSQTLAQKLLGLIIQGSFFLLISLSLLATFPCAQAALFSDDEARAAIMKLRETLAQAEETNQSELNRVFKDLLELSNRINRLENAQENFITQSQKLNQMSQEIAELRGMLEEQAHRISSNSSTSHPSTKGESIDAFSSPEKEDLSIENTPSDENWPSKAPQKKEKKAFDFALERFRSRDFSSAKALLETFLVTYPDSVYRADAQYWLGNLYFAIKDYKSAISVHSAFINQHPNHKATSDAMLNLGYAYIEIGKSKLGTSTLQELVKKFPKTKAAQLAKNFLSSQNSTNNPVS